MSQYLLPCSCGANIPVSRSQAGMSLPCPQCAKSLDVPTIRNMASLAAISDAPKKAKSSRAPIWLGPLAALAFLVAAAAFFYCGSLVWERYQILSSLAEQKVDLTITEEVFLADLRRMASESLPSDTWDYWNVMVRQGLSEANPPDLFRIKRYLESKKPSIWGSLATAVLSLAVFAVSALMIQRAKR